LRVLRNLGEIWAPTWVTNRLSAYGMHETFLFGTAVSNWICVLRTFPPDEHHGTYLHLVTTSRMCGALYSRPHYVLFVLVLGHRDLTSHPLSSSSSYTCYLRNVTRSYLFFFS
jgi:hypothetical protein